MTSDVLMISGLIAILALAAGYMAAAMKSKKQVSDLENGLAMETQKAQQLEARANELEIKYTDTNERLHQIGLENRGINTQFIAVKSILDDLEERLKVAEDKVTKAEEAKHLAEKQNESAQTELAEKKKQQEDLVVRLSASQNELAAEREKTSELKQANADAGKQAENFQVKSQEAQQKNGELREQLKSLEEKRDQLQAQYNELNSKFHELKSSLDEREQGNKRVLEQIDGNFKNVANAILETSRKTLEESNKTNITSVLTPFQESINTFKKEVQDIHHRETTQQGELKKELEALKELNQKITTEAHELSTALRGQKKLQGNWGELVLENVLDRSGLQLGKDYKREVSVTTEEGRQRPDAVVYLPQGKHLIIDAKVSLNAYTRFVNGEDEQERTIALREHVKAFGDRIRELADRDYYKLPGMNSPEMVFMFVPIESAFVEALKADETLFQMAIENNVLVATPTTLLTSLNIVRQLWRYEDQNKHTAALANKAEAVFKKFNTFLGSFEGIKKGLEKATESYTKAEGQLVSGKGNLVKQVGEFKNLAPAIKAELPDYFTEKAGLEIDYIPAEEPQNEDGGVVAENAQPDQPQQQDTMVN